MTDRDECPAVSPSIRVLYALCTLQKPSTAMLAHTANLSEWVVKRQLTHLTELGVIWRFERAGRSVDGKRGFYVFEDIGVFDRAKIISMCLKDGKKTTKD